MNSKFKIGRLIGLGLILSGAVVLTLSSTLLKQTSAQIPLMYISLGLLLAALSVIYFACRCPHCNHVILKHLIEAKRCPDCGRPLCPGRTSASTKNSQPPSSSDGKSKKRR